MPKRQPHSDNHLIDRAEQDSMPTAQGSSSGGEVNRHVGSRADEKTAQGRLEGDEVETATGADNPEQDARKGAKSVEHMVGGGSSPSR